MEGLKAVDVAPGDSFYIPSGTVHALGKGVLVAEIQQNSDTTYRLYDYDRLGLDGKPRELHIEDSLNVISYTNEGASRIKTDIQQPHEWLTLVRSPYFIVEKGLVNGRWSLSTTPGKVSISSSHQRERNTGMGGRQTFASAWTYVIVAGQSRCLHARRRLLDRAQKHPSLTESEKRNNAH